MSRRLDFEQYGRKGADADVTCAQFHVPTLGNLTVTFEDDHPLEDDPVPEIVLSIDFDLDRVRIIDSHGSTVRLGRSD